MLRVKRLEFADRVTRNHLIGLYMQINDSDFDWSGDVEDGTLRFLNRAGFLLCVLYFIFRIFVFAVFGDLCVILLVCDAIAI